MRRAARLLVLLVGGWLLTGVVLAGPASAHATLVSTDPGQGARVSSAPAKITITFDEPVSLGAGYAKVLDAKGARADAGDATVSGPVVSIPLRSGLPDGGYLVTYRVVSADSHPVAGAFSYVVGQGSFVPAGAAAVQKTDPVVGVALPLMRGLGYAGLALALGVPILAFVAWRAGWASVRLRRLATWGAGVAAGTAAADFLLQGPYAAGSGLGSVLDPALISATLGSLAGRAMLVRAVLAVALLFLLRPAWRSGTAPSVAVASGAGVLGLGICLSTALVGHAAAGSSTALALTVTTVHVAAMAVWLGGLAGLLAAVLRSDVPPRELAAAMPVFSRLAFGSVVALVVTGTLQAVREVGSVDALSTTAYGRLLLAKLALVILILAAAGVSRVWVQQHLGSHRARPGALRRVSAMAFAGGPPAPPAQESEVVETAAALRAAAQAEGAVVALPHLRRSVLVEFGCAIAVLAVTAVLVGSAPAKNAVSQPVDRTLALQGTNGSSGSIEVSIDPARPGPNSLHLYLFDAQGRLTQPEAIQLSLAEKEQQIGPIQVPLLPGGPGHYIADTNIVKAGTWTLTVVVRVDEFTATTASTVFSVR